MDVEIVIPILAIFPLLAVELNIEMGAEPVAAQELLLELRREHVDAAHDHHVVGAAGHLLHAPHGARRARQEPCQVARAIADDRHRLLGQRGEDEFAALAVRQHAAALRVDDLGIEVVFPDV